MSIRPISAILLGLALIPSYAVEPLDEADMEGVHIGTNDVLNVLGATAAGDVETTPIQQTAGNEAGLNLALASRWSDANRPARDFADERNVLELILPSTAIPQGLDRTVAAPLDGAGSTNIVVLPGERLFTSDFEDSNGENALRVVNDTRIHQISRDNVRFPNQPLLDGEHQTTISGFNIRADALIFSR